MGNRLAGGNIERSLPPWQTSLAHHRRAGSAQVFSEFIATAGLLSVIWDVRACARPLFLSPSELITGAYWFTASTSFANPVVTLARAASDTFAGIRPADVPWFVLAQFAGPWRLPCFFVGLFRLGPMSAKERVLILCTGNSARSQMAEGLLRHDAGDRFEVFSAGTKPGQVRPEAISVMREIGIYISGQRSKHVNEFADENFDYVLTVCDNANESCPIYPGHTRRLHRSFDDPAAVQGSEPERLGVFRRVRDEIRDYLRRFPPN